MKTPIEIAEMIRENPFCFPGGYEKVAITNDGSCICRKCLWSHREEIKNSTPNDGFFIVEAIVNWEGQKWCGVCSEEIPAEYGN